MAGLALYITWHPTVPWFIRNGCVNGEDKETFGALITDLLLYAGSRHEAPGAVVWGGERAPWMKKRVNRGEGWVLPFLGQVEPPGPGTHYTCPPAAPLVGGGKA